MTCNHGNLFVVAAPSGTGKTTLVKALVESLENVMVSISHTTRAKRPSEIHGVNYYFISEVEFKQMIAHHDFLEYAHVFDHLYGTSKSWVTQTLQQGTDVILEIDWQGHQLVKQLMPEAISIFILPPSLDDLRLRLETRDQDNPQIIEKRLADAKETISHLPEFDYAVVNDDFERAVHDLKVIISAGRLLESRQHTIYANLIEKLA